MSCRVAASAADEGVAVAADELTEEEKQDARQIFEGKVEGVSACQFCGGLHGRVAGLSQHLQPCPRIKRIEYHPDGSVLVVENWEPGTWERDVVFPHHVY